MTDLKRQIENAQKAMENWPDWMKACAHFQGSETKDSSVAFINDYMGDDIDLSDKPVQYGDFSDIPIPVITLAAHIELMNTYPALKDRLVEAINAKKRGKKLSLVDLGLDEAIEAITTLLGDSSHE